MKKTRRRRSSTCARHAHAILFVLRQAIELYDLHQEKILRCDEQIEARILALEATCERPDTLLPTSHGRRNRSSIEPHFEIQSPLFTLCGGVDLTALPGIGPDGALKLISEIGLDMSRWPTEDHFTSWLTVAPHNNISGGSCSVHGPNRRPTGPPRSFAWRR